MCLVGCIVPHRQTVISRPVSYKDFVFPKRAPCCARPDYGEIGSLLAIGLFQSSNINSHLPFFSLARIQVFGLDLAKQKFLPSYARCATG